MFKDLMNGLNEVGAFLAGEIAGSKVHLPADADVKSVPKQLKITQARQQQIPCGNDRKKRKERSH
jgi:hypothetical protein